VGHEHTGNRKDGLTSRALCIKIKAKLRFRRLEEGSRVLEINKKYYTVNSKIPPLVFIQG